MIIVSDALPIQFWPINDLTYNDSFFGFSDYIPFYQQFQIDDAIKLQLRDDDLSTAYTLIICDVNGNVLDTLPYVHTANYHQLVFQANALPVPIIDQCVRLYIVPGDGTFDSTFDSTFDPIAAGAIYKSDLINFATTVRFDASWGTKLIGYKSAKNFAGINYPNDDTYFYFRIPCQFFRQRPKTTQDSLPLSGSQVINVSITKGLQQLMKTLYVPDYIHNKLELILQHAATGLVTIDGKFWTIEESYDLTIPDEKSPLQMARVWLSDKNYLIKNMI